MGGHFCGECGREAHPFQDETFTIEHGGAKTEVNGLSGWRCGACEEVEFNGPSALHYAQASDELVLNARMHQADELKRVRKRLGLTQEKAGRLSGGGHNAFSRYERGEVPPMPAVVNLFRLLGSHPHLLAELDTVSLRGVTITVGKKEGTVRRRQAAVTTE